MNLEAHASRIEQVYEPVVTSAVDRLDLYLTTALLRTLDDDEQWRSLRELSRRLSSDVNRLQVAYPDLYTAADQPGRFPAAPLIALPKRVDPLHNAAAGARAHCGRLAALVAQRRRSACECALGLQHQRVHDRRHAHHESGARGGGCIARHADRGHPLLVIE